jgi:hypothetical protein
MEYDPGGQPPMYDLIISKQTLLNLGVVLNFKEETIQIDKNILPMSNIVNQQLKSFITRALWQNTCLVQEPVSIRSAALPSTWWKYWTLRMKKQIFQPL